MSSQSLEMGMSQISESLEKVGERSDSLEENFQRVTLRNSKTICMIETTACFPL